MLQKTINTRTQRCKETLLYKSRKYDRQNVLDNFYVGTEATGIPVLQYWLAQFTKHYVWLTQMCSTPDAWTGADWDEVLTDLHNYLFLLEALLYEMHKMSKPNS